MALATAAVLALVGSSAAASPSPVARYHPGGCGNYGHIDVHTGTCLGQHTPTR